MAVINQSFEKFQDEVLLPLQQKESSKLNTENSSSHLPEVFDDKNNLKKLNVFIYKSDKKNHHYLSQFRQKTSKIFGSQIYLAFVTVVIIVNTVILTLDSYPINPKLSTLMNYSNLAFTIFFFIEMILKIYAYTPSVYLKDKMNLFDLFIVWSSVFEVIFEYSIQKLDGSNLSGISTLAALRSFRLFRMFKILRAWKNLKNLIQALIESLISLKYFSILLLIFMIIATFLGNELFAYKVRFITDYQITNDRLYS